EAGRSRVGVVHDCEAVGGESLIGVRGRAFGAVGKAVATTVHRQHSAVPGEVRDLALPGPRVDDRPRRQEEHGPVAFAVHLPVQANTVSNRVALMIWLYWSHLASRFPSHNSPLARSNEQPGARCARRQLVMAELRKPG